MKALLLQLLARKQAGTAKLWGLEEFSAIACFLFLKFIACRYHNKA